MDVAVVKIGGSLALYPEKLRVLCAKLSEAAKKHKIIVVPGGGEFADVVRNVDKQFKLSREVSHRMAILGMEQYGLLLSDLITLSRVANQPENIENIWDLGMLAIFLPSIYLLSEDILEKSWDVTSDSIAVYIANKLHIGKVVLVTDVDGIYTCDPKKCSDAKFINELSAKQLDSLNMRTSVDKFLPKLLSQLQIQCLVVNGLYPERVEAILDGQNAVYTLIN
jgi:5-(aminomethyl)-3-furanmethanol phosphate kinase